MSLELKLMLCLSTAHLTAEVARELDLIAQSSPSALGAGDPEDWPSHIIAANWADYGWFIWVMSDGRSIMPPSLAACLDLAERSGADWLQFDRDCEETAGLPVHDW